MYEEFFGHFGLQRNPFHVSPDPKRFFSTVAHDEALLQLVFGIESRRGLMVLTGEPGTGKSTILQYLLEWLGQYKYSTAYVFHTMMHSADLLQLILRDFGISCTSRIKSDALSALEQWLIQQHATGDLPVIIIDEAQALTTRAMDELRVLLDLEHKGIKLVQIVLAGQPQLEEKLKQRKLSQLKQRIMCHCRLRPLTLGETSGYIASRLNGAGASGPGAFPQDVVLEIYRYSKGIPRVINLICENALLAAYADRREAIQCDDVKRVARQFDLAGESKEEEEEFRGDMFSRLIPFPKLVADTASVHIADAVELTIAVKEMATPASAEEAVETSIIVETMPAVESAGEVSASVPMIEPRKAGFLSYLGGTARSFVNDVHAFVAYFRRWMRRPVRDVREPGIRWRKHSTSLSDWLRLPFGSAHKHSNL
ncbi:MAG TPA: AAA family ATPase [Candidatus Acidoferrum sp.]|nr:AAA family ATPase [Candidatus Acidoferrum sp.]